MLLNYILYICARRLGKSGNTVIRVKSINNPPYTVFLRPGMTYLLLLTLISMTIDQVLRSTRHNARTHHNVFFASGRQKGHFMRVKLQNNITTYKWALKPI